MQEFFHPNSGIPIFFSLGWNISKTWAAGLTLSHSQANYANYYIKENFPSAPPIDKIVQNIEFIMVNSNEFVDYPRLLPPNVLQVGGLQMREPKPLPEVQMWCTGCLSTDPTNVEDFYAHLRWSLS